MAKTAPLDTTIQVVTPENIAFEYQLAGPFRRFPAYVIDWLVCGCFLFMLGILFLILAGFLGIQGSFVGPAFLGAVWLVAMFVTTWFYGALLETYWNGRTIGKRLLGLRVISIDGRPLSGLQATLRNILRVADKAPYTPLSMLGLEAGIFAIPTGIIGLLTTLCNPRMQRLGDLVAGTMVVMDEQNWRQPTASIDDQRVYALATYIPRDYVVTQTMARVLASYAERRRHLTVARRREIAKYLAVPLIDRFEFRPDIDYDLLLCALYYVTFLQGDTIDPELAGTFAQYSPLRRDIVTPISDSELAMQGSQSLSDDKGETNQPALDSRKPSPTHDPEGYLDT